MGRLFFFFFIAEQNKMKLEVNLIGSKKSELHNCTADVHRTLLGFLFPLFYTSIVPYIMPEKGVNSNINLCILFEKLYERSYLKHVSCFCRTSLLIQRPFSVIRQIFLRHLLNCSKLLQLNLHLLASVIIHHQEQYMPLT